MAGPLPPLPLLMARPLREELLRLPLVEGQRGVDDPLLVPIGKQELMVGGGGLYY